VGDAVDVLTSMCARLSRQRRARNPAMRTVAVSEHGPAEAL